MPSHSIYNCSLPRCPSTHRLRRSLLMTIPLLAACATNKTVSVPPPTSCTPVPFETEVTEGMTRVSACKINLYFNENLPVGTVVALHPRSDPAGWGYDIILDSPEALKTGRGMSVTLYSDTLAERRIMKVANGREKGTVPLDSNPHWFRKNFDIGEIVPDGTVPPEPSDSVTRSRASGFVILSN